MAEFTYSLAYADADEFIAKVKPQSFRRGNRINVRLSDDTDYVFTYMGSQGNQINGLSALNGSMVIIDLQAMTLTEQAGG